MDWVYDFALPPLVLHALYACDAAPLARWLAISPRNAVTVLDTHDGIGVIDVGADARRECPACSADGDRRSGRADPREEPQPAPAATGAAASNLDLYQVNCTFYDALGPRRRRLPDRAGAAVLRARAFRRSTTSACSPATNDMDLLARSEVGRDINRHYYTSAEIDAALLTPVVQRQIALIRFRNTHPAFNGDVQIDTPAADRIDITWTAGNDRAELRVDLTARTAWITATGSDTFPVHAATGRAITTPALD